MKVEGATPAALLLSNPLRRELEGYARAGAPNEVCGLLLGSSTARGALVQRIHPGRNRNVEQPSSRYELDPTDLLAAEESARKSGQQVIGVYHSHPEQDAVPSELDRVGAWAGWSYVILSVFGGEVRDLRAWRLVDDLLLEQEVSGQGPT